MVEETMQCQKIQLWSSGFLLLTEAHLRMVSIESHPPHHKREIH